MWREARHLEEGHRLHTVEDHCRGRTTAALLETMAEGVSRGRPGYLLLLTLEAFPKLEAVDAMVG